MKHTTHAYDLTATNAVWIALATLHAAKPEADGFTATEIEDEVRSLNLFQKNRITISTHIGQHLVATKRPNAKPRRLLRELSDGRYRLYVEGDAYHPSRRNSPTHPAQEDLPTEFRPLVDWYESWSRKVPTNGSTQTDQDPLLALAGTWTFGDADSYLRDQRSGWDG